MKVHKLTKEENARTWLCYSCSTGLLFCFSCKVMSGKNGQFVNEGFNDWKNAGNLILRHEESSSHRQCLISMLARKNKRGRVDAELVKQIETERAYWQNILQRVVEIIRFLAERGLAFRGSDEKVGSPSNGNYLGILELLSKFDPFLAEHINSHANKGKGHTSYLSKTTCEEFIEILGTSVLDRIVSELKSCKYYSVSVDSTPDVSHIDQISCIFRYVLPSGPVERFVKYLDMEGHSGEQLAQSLMDFLQKYDIDIKNCRGQTYDNASNMSGKYNGMQAHIRSANKFAVYVPCSAHSLNLVANFAVESCQGAILYFNFIQNLYSFFAASTHRWSILKNALTEAGGNLPVVKRLSDTRWSARADATKALHQSFLPIQKALEELSDDVEQKADCRQQARGLASTMDQLETGILTVLWDQVLQRFNVTSSLLQSADQDLNTSCALYESLIGFVQTLRDQFDEIENKGQTLTDCQEYVTQVRRKKVRNRRYDEQSGSAALDVVVEAQTPAEKFKTSTFLVMIDNLLDALNKRLNGYTHARSLFGFLRKIENLPEEELVSSTIELAKEYPEDIEDKNIIDEFLQFIELLKTSMAKEFSVALKDMAVERVYYKLITENNLQHVFPNIEIALRIYLCLMVTNCSGERSFSKLKRIKNDQRSTMGQQRLNHLALLSIEHELLREIDISDIIHKFSLAKTRKHVMLI